MGDEEDLGEPRLLRAECGEEIGPPLLVLAPEDLIEDEEGALVHLVEFREVAGEGDSQCDGDVVLLAAAEPVHGPVGVDVADENRVTFTLQSGC